MSQSTASYNIETEVPSSYKGKLLDFIYDKYVLHSEPRFIDVSREPTNGVPSLAFTVVDSMRKKLLAVEVAAGEPLKLKTAKFDETVSEQLVNKVREDLTFLVEFFEEKIRESTLFFAWEEGEKIVPETHFGKERKPINRMFLETQFLLAAVFLAFGLFLFLIIGWYAPLVLLAIQFVFVFYSNKFIARSADWHITEKNPTIHVLEYRLPLMEQDQFRQMYPKEQVAEIKKRIYEQAISKNGEIDCETAQKVLKDFGFACDSENLVSRKINVYQIVKRVADKFGFPMPEIVVSNTLIPNAAASGPSPSRGVVLITTGLLVQLEENEITSVLGHEFGHLRGRDPLMLYGLMGAEFLLRFYVLLPLFPIIFYSLLFVPYFWFVMTLIFFIAKFFEARADLVSAIVIGQPKVLAESLGKIGFKRLLYERLPLNRFQEWISLDPHPPIYFRVQRLEKLEEPTKIKHLLFKSASEVVKGFLRSS